MARPCDFTLSSHLVCFVFREKPKRLAALSQKILISVDLITEIKCKHGFNSVREKMDRFLINIKWLSYKHNHIRIHQSEDEQQ
jgi:hypothetical protein